MQRMLKRSCLAAICVACLMGRGVAFDAPTDTQTSPPLVGGVIAIWLQGAAIDREAILKLPVIKGGQVMVQWAEIEPEKGKYNFAALESQLAEYAQRKLPVTIQLNGNRKPRYLFSEVPYVKERAPAVPAFVQVQDREGTLMFWHPTHERAYVNCLVALRNYLLKSPYKSSIFGLRMNFNPFGTEGISIYPLAKAAEYAPKERWIQPFGLDRSIAYNGYNKPDALDYVRRIMRKHIELFNGVVPMFIRCTVDNEVLTEFSPYLENGTFGIFETGSCLAPFASKSEAQEEWIYRYCKSGKTIAYAESFANAWGQHTIKDDLRFAPPQAFYWRVLCDLHKGVSYIACYGSDLNMALSGTYQATARTVDGKSVPISYSDRQSGFDYKHEFNESLMWADKYAGYHAKPEQAPGAWIAFRESDAMANAKNNYEKLKTPCFMGDYTYLMERLPDKSVGVTNVGPDNIRYGAYARRLPAKAAMHLKVDGRFLASLSQGACRVRVIYFDDTAGGVFTVSASGQAWNVPLHGSKAWETALFEVGTPAFEPRADGAQVAIGNGDAPVCLHMVAIERK
jgi:hypothetical protein